MLLRSARAILIWFSMICAAAAVNAQSINTNTTQLPETGSVARTVVSRVSDATMATDFCSGTQLTGGADAQACLQNAVNALCSRSPRGGGTLYLPPGTYLVGTTVTVPCSGVQIVGAGTGDSLPTHADSVGTLIVAGGTSSSPVIQVNVTKYSGFSFGFALRDIQIYNGAGSTGYRVGPFLEMDHVQHAVVDNVVFYAPCTAIKIYGGNENFVSHVRAFGTKDNCDTIYLSGDVTQSYTTLDVVGFEHTTVSTGSNGNCFHIVDRVQTVWWTNVSCETAGHAITAACPTMASASNCPGFFTLDDFEAELDGATSGGDMIAMTDVVDGFKMTNSWLRGQYGSYTVNNLISSAKSRFTSAGNLVVDVSHSWLKYAGGACIYVTADQTTVTGSQIYGCNAYGGGAGGVQVNGGRASVTGNTFCGDDWLGTITWTMGSGGYVNTGVSYTVWTGNVFSGNVGGHTNGCQTAVINNGTAPNVIADNVGP